MQLLLSMMTRVSVDEGWRCANEAIGAICPSPNPKCHLSIEERELLLKLYLLLRNATDDPASSKLPYALGVTKHTLINIILRASKTDDSNVDSKKRCDTGQTILNCEQKRQSVITAEHIHKKAKRRENRGSH
jgi:hypothetical protein